MANGYPATARDAAESQDPGLGALFLEERAEEVRARARVIWITSAALWATSLWLVDRAVFSWTEALIVRVPELCVALAFVVWLRRPRPLWHIEAWAVVAAVIIGAVSGWGLLHVPPGQLVGKVASLVLASLAVVFFAGYRWQTNLLIGLLLQASIAPLWFAGQHTLFVMTVTASGFASAVVVVSAAARDRQAYATLCTRRELVRANERLRRDDELKRRLFTNLAHDFRTPLAVIHGEAELLRGASDDAATRAALDRVEKNAAALADLTDQLLDLARLEAGQMPVQPRAVDLGALMRDLAAQLAGRPGQAILHDAGAPLVARADPRHVARILTNLVANALRQAGVSRVWLRGAREGDRVVVDVIDDGPGVAPDRRQAIFERFVSFDRDGSMAGGVGLPLARELAALAGGSLELLTGPAETTFRLALPATDEEPSASSVSLPVVAPTTPPPESRTRAVQVRRRVLVVEDHPDMRVLIERTLERDFSVLACADVAEGRAALAGGTFAALLTDVMLPDGSGYDLLAHVRERPELVELPVIMVSAVGRAEERVKGLAAGAADYLAKPFAPDELCRRVTNAVERADARRRELASQREAFLMEVHDGVSASLLRASRVLGDAPGESDDQRLDRVRAAIADGLDEVRAIPALLSPRPVPLSALAAELRRALADACDLAGLELSIDLEGVEIEQIGRAHV